MFDCEQHQAHRQNDNATHLQMDKLMQKQSNTYRIIVYCCSRWLLACIHLSSLCVGYAFTVTLKCVWHFVTFVITAIANCLSILLITVDNAIVKHSQFNYIFDYSIYIPPNVNDMLQNVFITPNLRANDEKRIVRLSLCLSLSLRFCIRAVILCDECKSVIKYTRTTRNNLFHWRYLSVWIKFTLHAWYLFYSCFDVISLCRLARVCVGSGGGRPAALTPKPRDSEEGEDGFCNQCSNIYSL